MYTAIYAVPNLPVMLREMTAYDAYTVVRWRNSDSARAAFFSDDVVTPDGHRKFMANKKPNDLLFMAYTSDGVDVGMASLIVDVQAHTAEFGRMYVDDKLRRCGWGLAIMKLVLGYAFDVLNLRGLWLEVKADNMPAIALYRRAGFAKSNNFAEHASAILMEMHKPVEESQ